MRGDVFFDRFSSVPPFSQMPAKAAQFFREYLANEKVVPFGDGYVLNTHFPPYPSGAFDNFASQFAHLGVMKTRHVYSVTLAVTNRCPYRCWHCYNAGRSQEDVPLARLQEVIATLQDLGAVRVTLTGGEPLVRRDLEQIAAAFDDRTSVLLNTTGFRLTAERARRLYDSGVFAVGFSLDSTEAARHDRLRGHEGAFATALAGLRLAQEAGLYPYIVSVADREYLEPERFHEFLRFARDAGAREIHILEPCPIGKLAGQTDVLLGEDDRQRILDYQHEVAGDDDLPIVSSFAYLESADAFGCGAGLTHLYVDGSGEVCPCNFVPMSFGNVLQDSLETILDRMGEYFRQPRPSCIGHILGPHIPDGPVPTPPEVSADLCAKYLPTEHAVPKFFEIAAATDAEGD